MPLSEAVPTDWGLFYLEFAMGVKNGDRVVWLTRRAGIRKGRVIGFTFTTGKPPWAHVEVIGLNGSTKTHYVMVCDLEKLR